MTIIFYAKVGGKRYVGFGLPGWGVAGVAGALITLASATFFYLGDFAATLAHRKGEQRLLQYELARMEKKVQLVQEDNNANLDAATMKLGELHARISTLDTKGASLLAIATAYDDPSYKKRAENLVWTVEPPGNEAGFVARLPDMPTLPPVGSSDSN